MSEQGASDAPQAIQRDWFRLCQAIALVGSGRYEHALGALDRIEAKTIGPSLELPLVHAYTRLGILDRVGVIRERAASEPAIDRVRLTELTERLSAAYDLAAERALAQFEADVYLLNA